MLNARTIAIALLSALLVASCGGDPRSDESSQTAPPSSQAAEHVHQAPAPTVAPEPLPRSAHGGGRSPEAATSSFARAASNWTWRNVASKQASMAVRLSAGDVRERARASAEQLREDDTAARVQRSNSSEELAIDVQGSEPGRRVVWIVLRETQSVNLPEPKSHTHVLVYKATVERLRDGRWYVVGFEPQR